MSRTSTGPRFLCALALLILLLAACGGGGTPPPQAAATRTTTGVSAPLPTLPAPRPAGSCHVNGALPDASCTPGAVQEGVTAAMICAPGYTTRTIRPPQAYTDNLKQQQLREYGLTLTAADVEEDHLVPLELAGHPSSPLNLWPQNRHLGAGLSAGDKDLTENAAKKAVCDGRMSLSDAQAKIAQDWTALRSELMTKGMFTVENPTLPQPTEP